MHLHPFLVSAALLILPLSVSAFPLTKTDTLNCRASPSTSAKIIRTYKKGDDIKVSCTAQGTVVNGHNVWDKTQHGCFVSDYYVKTGTSKPVKPTCPGHTTPKPPPSGGTPAGVNFPKANCKKYVINAGNKLLRKFPNWIHTVWCYANKPGEHGKGRALDFMHKPHDPKGRKLAEYVMKNHKSLNVMYVIWEQRIWNPSRDKVNPWTKWRKMEDRGSCTQNHCDHVHVSFN